MSMFAVVQDEHLYYWFSRCCNAGQSLWWRQLLQ